MEKKDILIILSLFSVAFLIRAVGVPNVCMYGDEWLYQVNTNRILASNFAPRADVFDYAPPFLPYISAVFTLLFDGELNTLRMISVIFGSLTVPFLYLFGSAMYDRKTGLLSAFLLCFSAYHCLYSRILMLEALTLFFITAFLYSFWLSQRSDNRKSRTYAIIAGAMLGLAFDTKYISFFLIPAVLAYVLWTKRFSFKALLDKRMILISIFAFLFYSPVLICLYTTGVGLHPFYFMAIEKFSKTSVGHARVLYLPLSELVEGGGKMLEVLSTWGAEILTLPWKYLFELSATLLFIIILFYYLHSFVNRGERGSFLIISIFALFVLLLGIGRLRHYVIYAQPFYFVMFSHLCVKTFNLLKRENSYKNIFRTFIISLMVIVLFTSFITGVTSHYWDEGDSYPWVKSVVEYVKSDITKNEYEGYILIGLVDYTTLVLDYPFYLSDLDLDVYTISMFKPESGYSGEIANVDLDRLNIFKPDYLVVSEDFYKHYFKESVEREIFKDYRIVFYSQTYPHRCFVLKRKNMQPPELATPADGEDGKISQDVFKKSVPGVIKVGNAYTILVQVKNTGDSLTNFSVRVHSDRYTIFVDGEWSSVILEKDSMRILKFKMVPLKECVEELPITVDLYAKNEETERWRKVDSVSDYVYLIKK